MIFIDKSTNKLLGDQVAKDYLDNCCLDTATGDTQMFVTIKETATGIVSRQQVRVFTRKG